MTETRKRPDVLRGKSYRIETGQGRMYVTVNRDEGQLFEVFLHIGKAGSDTRADGEAIARLASLLFRRDCPVEEIIGQLDDIKGSSPVWFKGRQIFSIADALAKVLVHAVEDGPGGRFIVTDDKVDGCFIVTDEEIDEMLDGEWVDLDGVERLDDAESPDNDVRHSGQRQLEFGEGESNVS